MASRGARHMLLLIPVLSPSAAQPLGQGHNRPVAEERAGSRDPPSAIQLPPKCRKLHPGALTYIKPQLR